ncbi:MAG: GtrA family protein [Phocaeicola sp.]
MKIDRNKLLEFVRFCVVGGIAAGLHYATYYLLQQLLTLNVAYTIGYLLSLLVNFILTSYFTFRTKPSTKKAAGFGFSHLINYLIHIGLLNLFVTIGIPRLLAPVLVLIVAVPTTYLLLRIIYKPQSNHENH